MLHNVRIKKLLILLKIRIYLSTYVLAYVTQIELLPGESHFNVITV